MHANNKTFGKLKASIWPTAIAIPADFYFVPIGGTWGIPANIAPANADTGTKISWSSADPEIAAVDSNGFVTGKKAGTVTITATTGNGVSDSCEISVAPISIFDIAYGEVALEELQNRLKFPDTLEVFGVWAIDYPDGVNKNVIRISIYYRAMNSIGTRIRGEYQVFYDLNTGEGLYDEFKDSTSTHAGERVIDINEIRN